MRHLPVIALVSLLTVNAACGEPNIARAQEVASTAAPAAPAGNAQPSAAAPAPASTSSNSSSALVRFELAEAVEAREPVRPGQSFAAGSKVHAFLELSNKDGALAGLIVKFEREGAKPSNGVRLEVPALKRYRTHAFTTSTKKPGRYRCTVSTEDGQVLAQKDFEIVEAPKS